jgi:hypothetical protein
MPIILVGLAAALAVAVIVAREPRRSPVLQAVTPPGQNNSAGASLSLGVTYGAGLTHVAQSPVASLTPSLGNEWRRLGNVIGRVLLRPLGARSPYFELGVVAFAPGRSARLAMLTSNEQRAIGLVDPGKFQVITFGPLIAPAHGPIGIALSSVQPESSGQGADLLLSPLQAEYLEPGEAVMRMPALAEPGPDGSRGLYVTGGVTARFAMTPGIVGSSVVALQGATVAGFAHVTVRVGAETHSAVASNRMKTILIGPFSHAASVLSMTLGGFPGSAKVSVFIKDLRFASARPGA